MSLKLSTGLRNAALDTSSVKTLLTGKVLKIYSGTVPATADAALVGGDNNLLLTISNNGGGGGLSFAAAAANGALGKLGSQTWSGSCVLSGTATFFRLQNAADTNGASTTEQRVQGQVAVAGAELNLTTTALVNGTAYTIDAFAVAIPA